MCLVHTFGAVGTFGMIFSGAVITIEKTCLHGYVTGTNYPCYSQIQFSIQIQNQIKNQIQIQIKNQIQIQIQTKNQIQITKN
jgi:hypothetical protein